MLFKKLIRTFFKYKAQFISMIIMVVLGIGIFAGFNAEWYSIEKDTTSFFNETNLADYRIYNEKKSFSEDDLNNVLSIDGIDKDIFVSTPPKVKKMILLSLLYQKALLFLILN